MPNFSNSTQYDIYSVSSTPTTTHFCTNFTITDVSFIHLTLSNFDSNQVSFPTSNIIYSNFSNGQNCFTYNKGYSSFNPNNSYQKIIDGYLELNNGKREAITIVGSGGITEENQSLSVDYVNVSLSGQSADVSSTIIIYANTNIVNPVFSYFINNMQISNCQETSSDSCSFSVPNFPNNTDADIKVYASNTSVIGTGNAFLFINN